jgi:hypothetical protein
MNIEEKMFELVGDCLRSGKTQKAYSHQAGIGYAKFNYWACKYRERQRQTATGFVKVDTLPVRGQQDLEICYPNGVKLTTSGADLSLISQLIHLY